MNMKTQKEKNLEIINEYNKNKKPNTSVFARVPGIVEYAERQNAVYSLLENGNPINFEDVHLLSTEVKYPTKKVYDKKTNKLIMQPVDQSKLLGFLSSIIETNTTEGSAPEYVLYPETPVYKQLNQLLHAFKAEPVVQSSRFMKEDKLVHAARLGDIAGQADPTLIMVESGSSEHKMLTALLEKTISSCPSIKIDYKKRDTLNNEENTNEELDDNYETILEIVKGH